MWKIGSSARWGLFATPDYLAVHLCKRYCREIIYEKRLLFSFFGLQITHHSLLFLAPKLPIIFRIMTIHTCVLQCYIMDNRAGGTRGSIATQILLELDTKTVLPKDLLYLLAPLPTPDFQAFRQSCIVDLTTQHSYQSHPQCPRTVLNKRFLPKPMTATGWKGTP